MNDNRYFIVYFSGLTEDNRLQKGKIEYTTSGDKYVNQERITSLIEEGFDLTQVWISNLIELPEKDFKDWTDGRPELPPSHRDNDSGDFL